MRELEICSQMDLFVQPSGHRKNAMTVDGGLPGTP